jgi:hypothetical protein
MSALDTACGSFRTLLSSLHHHKKMLVLFHLNNSFNLHLCYLPLCFLLAPSTGCNSQLFFECYSASGCGNLFVALYVKRCSRTTLKQSHVYSTLHTFPTWRIASRPLVWSAYSWPAPPRHISMSSIRTVVFSCSGRAGGKARGTQWRKKDPEAMPIFRLFWRFWLTRLKERINRETERNRRLDKLAGSLHR